MTTVILNSNWRQFLEADEATKDLTYFFWTAQFLSTIFVIFITSVPHYSDKNPLNNYSAWMPKFHFSFALLIFIVTPVINILVYIIALI